LELGRIEWQEPALILISHEVPKQRLRFTSRFLAATLSAALPASAICRHSKAPPLAEADKNLIMHIELPILGGHVLMGTDAPESFGFTVNFGNNVFINLEPDGRTETDKFFAALSVGGKVGMPLQDMFWGAYFGSCTDKFGVQWMFNCAN
jgi:uncharacterized glyoxalase superfamily protein PhnB